MRHRVTCKTCDVNTFRKPTARVMLVASLLLLGACSGSSGSDGAKDKTSTTAAPATQTTKKPGGGKIGQKKETVAYCNTIRANKGKFSLKNRAAAAEAAKFGESLIATAPAPVVPSLKVLNAGFKDLAAAPTDAAFAVKKKTFATPKVSEAYSRLTYFHIKACKITK